VDKESLRLPHNPWIVDFDAQKYAQEHFLAVIEDIRKGNVEHYKYPKNVLEAPWVNLETGEVTDKRLSLGC
jgi:hypothetical protein